MRGETFLYPGAESTLVRDYLARLRRGERVPTSVLTAREDQVIKLIARDLHIALKTVEGHRANILAKLGMRDRVELTRYAIRAGLIEP
jgi:DNA-binding NarL/FixJ family response regulator